MKLKLDYQKHDLKFKFDAGTSRGVLREKCSWFLKVSAGKEAYGLGECGPLPGLSMEAMSDVEPELRKVSESIHQFNFADLDKQAVFDIAERLSPIASIRFGLETALFDLLNGGIRRIFDNSFSRGESSIPINGLVWMGDLAFMKKQIDEKIAAGFTCVKLKIGALDFEEELKLLSYIREHFSDRHLTSRVDANGAFHPQEALTKLMALSRFNLHSIEQPIPVKHWSEMKKLCQESPVDIALDEELIGINSLEDKIKLLESINPHYIILKPSLVGGIRSTMEWISLAEDRGIDWWMTSALESNLGLNAIAQLTAQYKIDKPHGLGTGQLYHNNIDSPLSISKGVIKYDQHKPWNYSQLSSLIHLEK